VTAELNIHLEDRVSTKTVWRELQKSSIHDGTAIAKPLISEHNAEMRE
jgi:adenosine deaminase